MGISMYNIVMLRYSGVEFVGNIEEVLVLVFVLLIVSFDKGSLLEKKDLVGFFLILDLGSCLVFAFFEKCTFFISWGGGGGDAGGSELCGDDLALELVMG